MGTGMRAFIWLMALTCNKLLYNWNCFRTILLQIITIIMTSSPTYVT